MIEHEWFTRAPSDTRVLKIIIWVWKSQLLPCMHSNFFNKCRNRTCFCMKSEWEIGHIESSYSERLRTFPPATAAAEGESGKHEQVCQVATFCLTYSQRMWPHLHVSEKDSRSPSGNLEHELWTGQFFPVVRILFFLTPGRKNHIPAPRKNENVSFSASVWGNSILHNKGGKELASPEHV